MRMYPTPIGLSEDAEVLILEAVSLRSRSVTITKLYGKFCKPGDDGKPYFFIKGSSEELAEYASTLPLQLKEGDVARLMTLAKALEDMLNIKYFFASDTTARNGVRENIPFGGN